MDWLVGDGLIFTIILIVFIYYCVKISKQDKEKARVKRQLTEQELKEQRRLQELKKQNKK